MTDIIIEFLHSGSNSQRPYFLAVAYPLIVVYWNAVGTGILAIW